jgi:tRNA A37 threonylcarbamoyladenosine modification protein TsaB
MTLKQLSQIPLLSYSTLRVNANKQDIPQLEADMSLLYNKRYVEQDINYEMDYRAYSHTLLMKQHIYERLNTTPYIYNDRKIDSHQH